MPSNFAQSLENPYASPALAISPQPSQPEQRKPAHGSLAIIFAGFILLLIGYLASNIFFIADLYHVGFGPNGKVIPSPLAAAFNSEGAQWGLYCLAAAAAMAGAVMVGSQAYNPLAIVCYAMCPLVGGVFLVGSPLRLAQKYAFPVAVVYLAIGTCLAGTGMIRLFSLYGQANADFAPVLASMMTEIGLALLAGALLKLSQIPAAAETTINANLISAAAPIGSVATRS